MGAAAPNLREKEAKDRGELMDETLVTRIFQVLCILQILSEKVFRFKDSGFLKNESRMRRHFSSSKIVSRNKQ